MTHNFNFIFVLTLVLFSFLAPVKSYSGEGGVPGTGDLNFNPASDTEDNHCVSPQGADLNADYWYDLSEQIIGPVFCTTPPFSGHFVVNTGEFIVAPLRWVANADEGLLPNFPLIYPAGYVPNGTPVEDALSKFESIRVVVDDRKEYNYPAEDIVKVLPGCATELEGINCAALPFPPPEFWQVFFLPRVNPQSVGMHTLKYFWTVSETLCNGWNLVCLAPGEHVFAGGQIIFEVVPGANQSQ